MKLLQTAENHEALNKSSSEMEMVAHWFNEAAFAFGEERFNDANRYAEYANEYLQKAMEIISKIVIEGE